METGDIEIMEREVTAKAWLAKIENQGVLSLSSSDFLNCPPYQAWGISDFTLIHILNLSNTSPPISQYIYSNHSSGNDAFASYVNSSGNIVFRFTDSLGAISTKTVTLNKSMSEGDTYIIFFSIDRDNFASVYFFNLNTPSGVWGNNGRIDISSTSDIDLSASNTGPSAIGYSSLDYDLIWPLPPVNRAMTSEEIHAYVSGIGSPNSLPEDLRGVGSLEKYEDGDFSLNVNNWDMWASGTLTWDSGNGGQALAVPNSTSGTKWHPVSNTNDIPTNIRGKRVFIRCVLNSPSATATVSLSSSGSESSSYDDTDYLISADGESVFQGYIQMSSNYLYIRANEIVNISSIEAYPLGQIFSCRPHRNGVHVDDTGNGFNWTNVNSPVIKPFSAGIR